MSIIRLVFVLDSTIKVVTIGGIYGTIVEVRDQTFIVKVSGNTDMEMLKSSVAKNNRLIFFIFCLFLQS